MRLDFSGERVLAVVAHPDDAELFCAGTLARAKADGATIGICVMCQGDKGQPAEPIANLAAVRRKEMAAAAKLLGAQLFRGEYGDGRLADGPPARKKLIQIYRRFKPTLVLAHAPNDYHADHRAASALAEAASWFCTAAGHKTAAPAISPQPALWWMDTANMAGFLPEFHVDVTDYVDLKRRMMACHKSQLSRAADGDFSPLEGLMLRQCQARGAQAEVPAAEAFRTHQTWKRVRACEVRGAVRACFGFCLAAAATRQWLFPDVAVRAKNCFGCGHRPRCVNYYLKGEQMSLRALIIHADDNVANLIGPGGKGESVECTFEGTGKTETVTLLDDIPSNHKFAPVDIGAGQPIIKYGLNIGRASCDIRKGEYVHIHNIESNRGRGDLQEQT